MSGAVDGVSGPAGGGELGDGDEGAGDGAGLGDGDAGLAAGVGLGDGAGDGTGGVIAGASRLGELESLVGVPASGLVCAKETNGNEEKTNIAKSAMVKCFLISSRSLRCTIIFLRKYFLGGNKKRRHSEIMTMLKQALILDGAHLPRDGAVTIALRF